MQIYVIRMYGTRTPYPDEYEYVQIPILVQYCTRTLKIFKEIHKNFEKIFRNFRENILKFLVIIE